MTHSNGSLPAVIYGAQTRPAYYLLDETGQAALPCRNSMEWARAFQQYRESGRHRVGETVIWTLLGRVRVSTVFLGLDHNFQDGPPILWETMIFSGTSYADRYCERYESYEDAVSGHARVVRMSRRLMSPWALLCRGCSWLTRRLRGI